MSRLPRLSRVLAVVALCCGAGAVGCGDDDSGGDDGASPRDSGTDADASFGDRPGDEGWPCGAVDPCNGDLVCAATPFRDGDMTIGVCAEACDPSGNCDDGECISYTGEPADAHCVNVIDEEYEFCGVADTSVCSRELTCLYFPDQPVGVCVMICAADDGADAGVDAPGVTGMCSGEQSCIEGVLSDPEPGEGVCGALVERGESCGLDTGRYCGEGDICAPEDPDDASSAWHCFQDCSTQTGSDCEEGTCTLLGNQFAYCI
jgi:hypothetical protein